jgi:uncharacterized protein (TIGR00297 family)
MIHVSLRLLVGAVMGAAVAGLAWRARSLSASGAVAAAAIGTVAVAAGNQFAALLIFYFVSSSLLSRFGKRRKAERTAGTIEKAGARDAQQVLANGFVFAVACWMNVVSAPPELFLLSGTGALTASAADTWATEIGTLFGGTPRSILTWRRLPVGASGGVTIAGTLASLGGAICVGGFGVAMGLPSRYFVWIVAGGLFGSFVDSIAGALIQERRWCDACGSPTEMRIHVCGAGTRRVGGVPFVANDAVNLLATAAGAIATVLLVGTFA